MPVYQIKRIARLETLRAISPRALLSLLRPHARFLVHHGLSLPAARANGNGPGAAGQPDLKRLADILAAPDLRTPKPLADALFYINEMATRDGMDALLTELDASQVGVGMFHVEPADVAVRAWLKDPALVERKHAEIFASQPRRFEYFQSADEPPRPLPSDVSARLPLLQRYLDEVFASRGRGRGVRVLAYPYGGDGSGSAHCLFMVRHADPRRREGAMDGTEETSVLYRPLRFDVVGYDGGSGTLRVYAKTKWETSLYRGAFGRFLFDAMDHFPGVGRYTLDPLRGGDPACLAWHDVPPIKHVNLTEVHLHWGGVYDAVEVHRASDVFGALRDRRDALRRPRIAQATFAVFVFGDKRPRTVTIVPPNVARYSDEDLSPLIDRWLGLRGFINGAGTTSDGQAPDSLLQVT